ncbi:MAG: glycosyltransferase family 4 protein [Deltaproteobacteria bacterium]|nr:glycosyltransferase family 4 protein [Deltaproteobacteria bacterium]MBF0507425.1 glycosyltransferase family 4 protein [Deltaproteobacteria bacterium]
MVTIAVTGFRGVPGTWGGVEHQCEELYSRLAAKGYRIIIYARNSYVPKDITLYKGMEIRRLPTINTKYTEALIHTFLSILHILKSNPEIVHIYSQGPAVFSPLVRLFRPKMRLFFTCGGLDWQRKKWPPWASRLVRIGEWCSAVFPHYRIVVSKELVKYYKRSYGVEAHYIPNGIPVPVLREPNIIRKFGLTSRGYFLFVGRLVPEKRVEDIIMAFGLKPRGTKLVIVGDSAGADDYVRKLKLLAGNNSSILFIGFQYGEAIQELYSNARAFVNASELEGLPLTVLEAFSYGLECLLSDIEPHREIMGFKNVVGHLFPVRQVETLARRMDGMDKISNGCLKKIRALPKTAVESHYSWDAAALALEKLYLKSLEDR